MLHQTFQYTLGKFYNPKSEAMNLPSIFEKFYVRVEQYTQPFGHVLLLGYHLFFKGVYCLASECTGYEVLYS